MRLDRLIQSSLRMGTREARHFLAARKVKVNGIVETMGNAQIGYFDCVEARGEVLQARTPRYVMLHKPIGVVSATTDLLHQTVIDLIREPWAGELHLAGRLDRFTSGLVVLTNDGIFSKALTLPQKKVPKTYIVTTDADIPPEVVSAFEKGMPFAKEGVTTEPAIVNLLRPKTCRLTIFEGKHHQVKRMFLRFGIRVVALHRESVGNLHLYDLAAGMYRELTAEERLVP
ncbi:MAG: pseudouridine synthase [Verrucomicrobiales bacterium]